MRFENETPFPAVAWENQDADGSWHVTTVARVTYRFHPTDEHHATLVLDSDQGELFGEDVFWGEMGQSSLRYEGDYVPFKPMTDVIVNGHAYLPEYTPKRTCRVTVLDPNGKPLAEVALEVRAPDPTRGSPMALPIRYEYARGGGYPLPTEDDPYGYRVLDRYNPVGLGMWDDETPESYRGSPLILFADAARNAEPYPAGLGAIFRAWESRITLAGTYDDDWIEHQHPLPPFDADPRFNQAAHPLLQIDPYLPRYSRIRLEGFWGIEAPLEVEIPDPVFFNEQYVPGAPRHMEPMPIDTVIIDLPSGSLLEARVFISYRNRLPRNDAAIHTACYLLSHDLIEDEEAAS